MTKGGFIAIFYCSLFYFLLIALPCRAAETSAVSGKAKVLNTDNSYLDFTSTYNSNVIVNNSTGNFSGYAWLEDIGWCDFGTTDNPSGPVRVNLTTGAVTDKAYCINTAAYIDFTNYSSNVTINFSTGAFSGYGWSEDVGWLNFADSGVTLGDAGPAISGLSAWTDSTHTSAVAQNTSQKDGQISFTWTDLRPQTGDYFYYEYNQTVDDSITGDESYTTNTYKDDVLLKEGTSYFHVRPRVGASGAWGTESVFKIIYDATDNLSKLGGTLISPNDQSYTANTQPTFIFRKGVNPLSGVDHYELIIDDGRGGSFNFENIPPEYTLSGNQSSQENTFKNDKISVYYQNWQDDNEDNDYIHVWTLEEEKKLKEGARTWTVKAVDSVGNSRQAGRVLNVDLTRPEVVVQKLGAVVFDKTKTNWFYSGQRPKFALELKDRRAGEEIAEDNQTKISSGPAKLEIEILQKNFWGDFVPFILTLEQVSVDKGEESLEFVYQPQVDLSPGNYKVSFITVDYVGHQSDKISFELAIVGQKPSEQRVAEAISQKEKELGRPISEEEKEKVVEELEVGGPAEQKENLLKKLLSGVFGAAKAAVKGVWWKGVGAVKFVASQTQTTTKMVAEKATHGGRFIARTVLGVNLFGYLEEQSGSFVAQLQQVSQKAGEKILGVAGVYDKFAYAVNASRRLLAGKTQPLTKKLKITANFLASVWFDKEPTKIANLRLEEVGADYAVVVWKTNHYATSKVSFGETFDYGQDIQSDERVKDHRIKITGLKPGTKYYYEVMSQNKNYVFDARHEFRTADK